MQIHQEKFEAWLFSQPDEREWNYMSNDACLVCSFVKETSSNNQPSAGGDFFREKRFEDDKIKYPSWLYNFLNKRRGIILTAKEMKANYITLFGNPLESTPEPTIQPLNPHISLFFTSGFQTIQPAITMSAFLHFSIHHPIVTCIALGMAWSLAWCGLGVLFAGLLDTNTPECRGDEISRRSAKQPDESCGHQSPIIETVPDKHETAGESSAGEPQRAEAVSCSSCRIEFAGHALTNLTGHSVQARDSEVRTSGRDSGTEPTTPEMPRPISAERLKRKEGQHAHRVNQNQNNNRQSLIQNSVRAGESLITPPARSATATARELHEINIQLFRTI